MVRIKILIILSIFMLNFIGCDSDDNITGNNVTNIVGTGDVVSKTLDLPPFNSVTNLGVFAVNITKGSPQNVVLRAQQNILDVVTYEVENEELQLSFQENVSVTTSEEITADITIEAINRVTCIGVGNFNISGSKQSNLYIDITGAGNVDSYNLEVDTCYVTISGVGNCRVRANNLLNVTITGVGNLYYKGNPIIYQSITSLGRIFDVN